MEQDVGAYYNQTQNHYQRWWQLEKGMALHYGIWHDTTSDFIEALANTNIHLAELANVSEGQQVLDAGCGVGGSAIFLAKNFNANVTGITLSDLQAKTARDNAIKHQVDGSTNFQVVDFTQTGLVNEKFDLIWACESSSSAADKQVMANEWYRLLKPGGKLVLSDFFKADNISENEQKLLDQWSEIWAMAPLVSSTSLGQNLSNSGFEIKQVNNLTKNIYKTARRMYTSYWLGLIPSVLYNILFGAKPYARNHYKSGLYQYKSLKLGLWQYECILAIKPLSRYISKLEEK